MKNWGKNWLFLVSGNSESKVRTILKPPDICCQIVFQKGYVWHLKCSIPWCQDNSTERIVFSTNSEEKDRTTEYPCKRMKVNPFFTSYSKINSKWIKDPNVKANNYKTLRQKTTAVTLHDLGLGNKFLNMSSKAQTTKKINWTSLK